MSKIHWSQVGLFDSDGGQPDESKHRELMREYLGNNSIHDYWLVPPPEPDDDNCDACVWCQGSYLCYTMCPSVYITVWDSYHNEYREIWEAGPDVDDIDWDGIEQLEREL